MRTRAYAWIVVIAAAAAGCGKSEDSAPKKAEGEGGSGSAAAPATPGSGSGSGSAAVKADATKDDKKDEKKKPAEPAPVTAKAKEKEARCSEPCLMLTDTPLDKLSATYKTECNKATKDLGFEDCAQLDYTRNCIYAAHGMVFRKKKWKVFEKKTWYEAVPAFKSEITDLERNNVHELLNRGKACKKGLHVSGADFERLTAWFGALPKKPRDIPAVWLEDKKATPDELAAWLKEQLFADDPTVKKKKKFKFDSKTSAVYEKNLDEIPADAMALFRPAKGAKLRSIFVDITTFAGEAGEDAISEGIQLRFVYTDKDKLVGIVAAHYLND